MVVSAGDSGLFERAVSFKSFTNLYRVCHLRDIKGVSASKVRRC